MLAEEQTQVFWVIMNTVMNWMCWTTPTFIQSNMQIELFYSKVRVISSGNLFLLAHIACISLEATPVDGEGG